MDFKSELVNFCKVIQQKKGVSLNQPIDKDLIQKAIELGYDDAKRTFDGIKNYFNQKRIAFENLKESISNFFDNTYPKTQDEYNKVHQKWCNDFIDDLNPFIVSYGQAQKVINMAMKYLYCLSDATKKNYFKYCHMALDSYILAWYNREKIGETIKTSWSKLGQEEYKTIQGCICKHLQRKNNYFKRELVKGKISSEAICLEGEPIKAEFVIWSCETGFAKLQEVYKTMKDMNNDVLTQADKVVFKNLIQQIEQTL